MTLNMKILILLGGLALAPWARAQTENTKEVEKLIDEYTREDEKWYKKHKKPTAGDYDTHPLREFIPKFKALAEANRKTPGALASMLWVIQNSKFIRYTNWENKAQYYEWAIKGIRDDFAADPRMTQILPKLIEEPYYYGPMEFIPLFEAVAKHNPDKEARAWATYALGVTYKSDFGEVDTRPYKEKLDGRRKAVEFLRKVATEFPDSEAAREAAVKLKAFSELREGSKAPPLEGVDIDGKPVKLSDYAGKVVVVDFWTLECDDCKQVIELAKKITESLKDKPFVWLGVNVDPKYPDELKKEFAAVGATGTHITDRDRKLTRAWGVDDLPAVFIIDQQGTIRHRQVKPARIQPLVEALLNKTEARPTTPAPDTPTPGPTADKPTPPAPQSEPPKPDPPKPAGEPPPPKSDPAKDGGP